MQKQWEDFYKAHNYFHLEPNEALKGFVSKCSQLNFDKVLDLGCGAGTDLLFLAERGFDVTGVDFSPSAASNAEDLLQSKNFQGKIFVDNLFDKITTFNQGEFQGIIAINSLEFTDDLETFKSAIEQIADILVENGIFLLVMASEKSKLHVEVPAQIFLTEDEVSNIASMQFNMLDFSTDNDENFVLLLQKKNTNTH